MYKVYKYNGLHICVKYMSKKYYAHLHFEHIIVLLAYKTILLQIRTRFGHMSKDRKPK